MAFTLVRHMSATFTTIRVAETAALRGTADDLDDLDGPVAGEGSAYADVSAWADELQAAVGGYGPLQRLFDDPDVEEVWWNEPSRV